MRFNEKFLEVEKMLNAILVYSTFTGIAIWMPRKENTQGLPATLEEKLRFTVGNVVGMAAICVVAQIY